MTDGRSQNLTRAEDMRAAFDRTFAQPPVVSEATLDDLLLIGVAGDPYAVRLLEVAGVFAGRKVRWLPSSVPMFIGLVGLRGSILPVYDLRLLFGYQAMIPPRWLFIAASAPIVLACDRFDGHRRVHRTAMTSVQQTGQSAPHVREVVELSDGVRPLIHVPSVTDAIAMLGPEGAQPKE